ncbi:ribonuclease H-like domain-containing protein [Tanacetum coccineum]
MDMCILHLSALLIVTRLALLRMAALSLQIRLDVKKCFFTNTVIIRDCLQQQPPAPDPGFRIPTFRSCLSFTAFSIGFKQAPRAIAFLQSIIATLHAEFSMTDLGPLNYFLGISVTRNTSGDVLLHLNKNLAGALQYLTFTRPDISYAVQQVCLYMHDPREPHFSALKRILRYIRGTMPYGLQLFSSTTSSLVAYSDADWAGAEAEYRGVANAVAETCWLRNLLRELHTPLSTATLVYCDNIINMNDKVDYVIKQEALLLQQTSQNPSSSPPSASSSPTHEFSFTVAIRPNPPPTATQPQAEATAAIDLSPADDIFLHGHLLPLHVLADHLPVSPSRSSTNSMDSFTLPMNLLYDQTNPIGNNSFHCHHQTNFFNFDEPEFTTTNQERPKSKAYSIFGMPKSKKSEDVEKRRMKIKNLKVTTTR